MRAMVSESVWTRVRRGAQVGLGLGALLATWALLVAAVTHTTEFRNRYGVSYSVWSIVPTYIIGGGVTGGLVGSLSRLLRYAIGAALVGMISVTPIAAAILATRSGFTGWSRLDTVTLVMFSVCFGIPGGLVVRALRQRAKIESQS